MIIIQYLMENATDTSSQTQNVCLLGAQLSNA